MYLAATSISLLKVQPKLIFLFSLKDAWPNVLRSAFSAVSKQGFSYVELLAFK